MRILLINSEYPPIGGGAGNASKNLAREMTRFGHEVTVVTSRFDSLPNEEFHGGVQIIRIPALRRRLDRSGALEQGIFMLSASLYSMRTVRKHRPDIVLAFFGVPSGAVALGINLLLGVPYVVSLRGGDVPGFRPYDFALYHRLIGPLLHIIWRRAKVVVANSEGLRELGRSFDNNVPIDVIPNGVSMSQFKSKDRNWDPARLLIVGRVVYQKGIDQLLNALAGLLDLDWDLTVAGDGPQREPLEKMAHQFGIADRVRFLGWQSKDDLLGKYQQANLFVYPSRHEGMPNVVLEAMATGLPVIASNIAGNEELVLHGKTGLLVQSDDLSGLREAIRELILAPGRRRKMGATAQKRVEEQYTWANTATQYIEVFENIMESS